MTKTRQQLAFASGLPEVVTFVRHAESERNADPYSATLKAVPDCRISITARGIRQGAMSAVPLREYLGAQQSVRYSPHVRTAKTKDLLLACYSPAELSAMDIKSSRLLVERNAGEFYGKTPDEIEALYPGIVKRCNRAGAFRAVPPNGESLMAASVRAARFIKKEFPRHAGKKLLVITHDGMIRCFRFLLEGWSEEKFNKEHRFNPPQNCGFTAYFFSPHAKRLERAFYNKVFFAA